MDTDTEGRAGRWTETDRRTETAREGRGVEMEGGAGGGGQMDTGTEGQAGRWTGGQRRPDRLGETQTHRHTDTGAAAAEL